jgi:endo-1,4-beta-xylanase
MISLDIPLRGLRAHGRWSAILWLGVGLAASGCSSSPRPATAPRPAPAPNAVTLRDAFRGAFLVGAALNESVFTEADAKGAALVKAQFNTTTPENVLKWEAVHPQPGVFAFTAPDRYVDFGQRNGMAVIGHTLVWHNQVPRWVFQDSAGKPVSRDTLIARMRDHIMTVVGRYKGRIKGWDVVNEAVDEDGSLRKSPWLNIIGPDFLVKAYQFAHEADPNAELYYNDYSLENRPKREGAVALIKRLQAAAVHVTAIGLQGHDKMDWPSVAQQDSTIDAFAALGIKVNITEFDIDVLPAATRGPTADVTLRATLQASQNPYAAGLPDSVQQALAARYGALFGVFMKHRDVITRVTFWGVGDGDSWLNNWPVRGRTSYPLLFDRDDKPKPAFDAVMRQARPVVVP